ncbi:citrate synthase [Amycolatopsis samaneae]|uniref:citrate synthase (unknown stereospecificity) n=1 Tax=Amycolatopsis samaneae TaxID=664691 RepID=A0ABW5GIH3_9PSEU
MSGARDERYLSTDEVARMLDVKPETVYAYVSRGLLTSVRGKGRRGSVFARDEVEGLARRGARARRQSGAVERVGTALTLIEDDELYYRGRVVTELAVTRSAEEIARLLWAMEDGPELSAPPALLDRARSALTALPEPARLTDRLRVIVAVLGAADPLRFDLSPAAVVRAGGTLLGALVDALPPGQVEGTLAERMWPKLTGEPGGPALLNSALVLLADHDLAVSTVAARVAASARANPYAVVSAGLGAMDGPYHGAASTLAHRFLTDALADPVGALSERLRTGQGVPGFGHRLYRRRDPRADLLFQLLADHNAAGPVLAVTGRIGAELAPGGLFPNVDLALAALAHAFGMRADAGEAIFAVARTIGWIAHALEEYREPGLRFRPTGVYTGERPEHAPS